MSSTRGKAVKVDSAIAWTYPVRILAKQNTARVNTRETGKARVNTSDG